MKYNFSKKLLKEAQKVDDEKVMFISGCGLSHMFSNGLIKDFERKDFQALKLVNINYNRARDSKYKDKAFEYLMFGDIYANKLSDEGFKKLKDIYETYILPFLSALRTDEDFAKKMINLKKEMEKDLVRVDSLIDKYQ